jgi:hypothetical protein
MDKPRIGYAHTAPSETHHSLAASNKSPAEDDPQSTCKPPDISTQN